MLSMSPSVKQIVASITKPSTELMMIALIMALGRVTLAFLISSAISLPLASTLHMVFS